MTPHKALPDGRGRNRKRPRVSRRRSADLAWASGTLIGTDPFSGAEVSMRTAVLLAVVVLLTLGAFVLIRQGTRLETLFAGGLLVLVGLPLLALGRRQLGGAFSVAPRAKVLVTHGLYARIPHPMYMLSRSGVAGSSRCAAPGVATRHLGWPRPCPGLASTARSEGTGASVRRRVPGLPKTHLVVSEAAGQADGADEAGANDGASRLIRAVMPHLGRQTVSGTRAMGDFARACRETGSADSRSRPFRQLRAGPSERHTLPGREVGERGA